WVNNIRMKSKVAPPRMSNADDGGVASKASSDPAFCSLTTLVEKIARQKLTIWTRTVPTMTNEK
ncbi:MAG: hypothetical protein QOF01_1395, partial [Thermomicrobiales bacterium]|nr:hypothetical protein [Thermomicrobiales bacterium]